MTELTHQQAQILELATGDLTISQIADRLGADRSSVYRTIASFHRRGIKAEVAGNVGQSISAVLAGLPTAVRDELIASVPPGASIIDEIRARLTDYYLDMQQ